MGRMVVTPVKRRLNGQYDDSKNSRQQVTLSFSLLDGTDNIVQVCKNIFMEVFEVTKRRVETIVSRKKR